MLRALANKGKGLAVLTRKAMCLACMAASALAVSNSAKAQTTQEISEEVNKQIARLISASIANRIGDTVTSPDKAEKAGEANSAWASYTNLNLSGSSGGTSSSFHPNIYMAGYGRQLSKELSLGIAVEHDRLSTNIVGTSLEMRGTSISPYIAYTFTPNVFAVGTLRRSDGTADIGSPVNIKLDFEGVGYGVSVNGIGKFDNLSLKGKAGIDANEAKVTVAGASAKGTATSYSLDGELDYDFSPQIRGLAGIAFDSTNRPNTDKTSARLGIEYSFSKTTALSLKYDRVVSMDKPLGIDNFKIDSWTLGFRTAF